MKKLNKLFLKVFVTMIAFSIALLPMSVKAESINTYFKAEFNQNYPDLGLDAPLFKLLETYDEEGLNVKDQYNFYCLKAGVGFGSDRGRVEVVNYTQRFNLKDLDSIPQVYKDALPQGENYNSVMWILDHMFLDGDDASLEDYFKNIPELNDETPNGYTWEDYAALGKERVQIIQQVAIWHFTNPGEIYDVDSTTLRMFISEGNENTIDNFYNWLITGHENYSSVDISKSDIEINTDRKIIQSLQDGSYKAGPYKVVIPKSKLSAINDKNNIDISFSDNNGNNIEGVRVVDEEGNNTTVKANTDFYIMINSDVDVKNIVANLNVDFTQRKMDYYSVGESAIQTNQPLVKVTESPDSKPLTFEIPIEKFDLALRKYITKINGVDVNISREPSVDVSPFDEGKTTANYNHTKKPLKVAPGDIITYTIRVYNEGEVDGYASEITDFLPQDLEFIETDETNAAWGWDIDIDADSDGKIIRTHILSKDNETESNKTLIKAYDKDTKELSYKEVQVVCKVANNPTATKITNIAAITGFKDKDGNAVTDRDSDVGTLPAPAGNKVGKDLENYKDDEISREEEYIPGRQDDDDFEKVILKQFDLALRKYIVKIGNKEVESREPVITDSEKAKIYTDEAKYDEGTTAEKTHTKDPLSVTIGDTVLYTIRIYNEGEIEGCANTVTDYLPEGLTLKENSTINTENGWTADAENPQKVSTTKLSTEVLKPTNGTEIDYKDIQIECTVNSKANSTNLKNIAEITKCTDKNGNDITDRDSEPGNVNTDKYNPVAPTKGKGEQDDDDYEDLKLKQFDLALRKFITKVDDEELNRQPVITDEEKAKLGQGEAKYDNGSTMAKAHSKDKVKVQKGSTVVYRIRVYNEGEVAGYASIVTDYLPEGLTLKENSTINTENGWTADAENPQKISTTKLSTVLLKEFDKDTNTYYSADLEVECIVNDKANANNLKNIAEITENKNENGENVTDKDSQPGNVNTDKYNPTNPTDGRGEQDDDDFEDLELVEFDLSLRKFITKVNSTEIDTRIPKVDDSKLKDGTSTTATYNHPKDPVLVTNGSIVTYTIRVYNEGDIDGYAAIVEDDLPEGIKFIPEHTTNEEYRWVMLDKDGKVTDKVEEAVKITTDYLSKEQSDERIRKGVTTVSSLLKAYDGTTTPDYRDLKVAFEVVEPNTSERIIENKAQITKHTDKNGRIVTDRDSTPGKWIEGEDDQDIEKIKVQWFDLALRKWVTHAIVIENGEERITETGHKAEDDPEDIVKVDLKKSKINNVTVKFKYSIRVTNEGTIAGYAKEIKDHIPDGLKFVQEDNPEWKEIEEGIVVTEKAKDILLQPGESTEVEILLTWINNSENMGLKVNIAEISKDYNEFNAPDIDSTPDNFKAEEDDQDDAPVMLAIQTGEAQKYILVTGAVLVILGTGVALIKKYVM